jgi:hypothetical protein
MRLRSIRRFVVLAVVAALGSSCGDDSQSHSAGSASGAVCPSDSTLTYSGFGQAFTVVPAIDTVGHGQLLHSLS